MITYAELRQIVGEHLGYQSDVDSYTTEELNAVDKSIKSGIRKFLHPNLDGFEGYSWSFLTPELELDLVSGTATYVLPDNVSGLMSDLFFDSELGYAPITFGIAEHLLRKEQARLSVPGVPKMASMIIGKDSEDETKTVRKLVLYPTPGFSATVTYHGILISSVVIDADESPLGADVHSEIIIQSCIAAADRLVNDDVGANHKSFIENLRGALHADAARQAGYQGATGQSTYSFSGAFENRPFFNI